MSNLLITWTPEELEARRAFNQGRMLASLPDGFRVPAQRQMAVVIDPRHAKHLNANGDDAMLLAHAAASFRSFLNHWQFLDQDTGQVRILGHELWAGQEAFIAQLDIYQWIMALKARQLGYTTIECAYDAWAARFRWGERNARVHLFSKKDDDAIELLERVKFGMERLPEWMQLPQGKTTTHELRLLGGPNDERVIKAHATGENPSRGSTCTHAHVDEWAAMSNPAKVWQAVEPTLAGTAHMILTGDGPNNWTSGFWKRALALDAVDKRGHPILPFFTSALNRPDRTDAWLRAKQRSMGDDTAFFHEYAMKWEDALYGGGEYIFQSAEVDAANTDARGLGPSKPGRKYVKAWDIGRHKDAAVGIVLDITEDVHDVVAYQRLREYSYPMIQREIEIMDAAYDGITVIEDNAAGEAVRENLNIPEHRLEGFKTTKPSKARILQGTRVALQHQTLKWDSEACGQLDAEIRGYQLPDDGVIQDSVMALAIAEDQSALAHLKAGTVRGVINV